MGINYGNYSFGRKISFDRGEEEDLGLSKINENGVFEK
jgi:hypothetical protein